MTDLRDIADRGLVRRPSPLLRHLPGARFEEREGLAFVSWGHPGASFNKVGAVLPGVPGLARVEALGREVFGKDEFGVLVWADAGHPLETELRSAGWTVAEDEPAMVLPALPPAPAPPAGLVIRPMEDVEGRRDFLRVMRDGFGAPTADAQPLPDDQLDSFAPSLEAARDPDVAVLVGYSDSAPVAAAVFYRIEEIAVVTGVATVPGQRRRGLGRALTADALEAGRARGCRCAALNALGASEKLYAGMGFVHAGNHRTYVRQP